MAKSKLGHTSAEHEAASSASNWMAAKIRTLEGRVSELEQKQMHWDSLAEMMESLTALEQKVALLSKISMFVDLENLANPASQRSGSLPEPLVYELIEDDDPVTEFVAAPPEMGLSSAPLDHSNTTTPADSDSCQPFLQFQRIVEDIASETLDVLDLPIYVNELHRPALETLWQQHLHSFKQNFVDGARSSVPALVDQLGLSASDLPTGSFAEAQLRSLLSSILSASVESCIESAKPLLHQQRDLLRKSNVPSTSTSLDVNMAATSANEAVSPGTGQRRKPGKQKKK